MHSSTTTQAQYPTCTAMIKNEGSAGVGQPLSVVAVWAGEWMVFLVVRAHNNSNHVDRGQWRIAVKIFKEVGLHTIRCDTRTYPCYSPMEAETFDQN